MSTRGEIVVECDTPACHAEQVYSAKDLVLCSLDALLDVDGWVTPDGKTDLCPACAEAQEP